MPTCQSHATNMPRFMSMFVQVKAPTNLKRQIEGKPKESIFSQKSTCFPFASRIKRSRSRLFNKYASRQSVCHRLPPGNIPFYLPLSREGVVSSHSVIATGLCSRHGSEFGTLRAARSCGLETVAQAILGALKSLQRRSKAAHWQHSSFGTVCQQLASSQLLPTFRCPAHAPRI